MTREKYESLPLSTLKALAKSRNMKGISTLRKEALIERMLEEDQKNVIIVAKCIVLSAVCITDKMCSEERRA